MELDELKSIWSRYDKKLDKNLKLNIRVIKELNLDKTKSNLHRLMVLRMAELLFCLMIVISLGDFIGSHIWDPQFAIPAFILNVFAIIGLAGSIGQIALIGQIDYSDSITSIQRKIEKIQSHMLMMLKLLILSLPFYIAYIILGFKLFFDIDAYAHFDHNWWVANIIFSVALVPLAMWIYRKLSFKNDDHSLIRKLIDGTGGKQITAAAHFLYEIEEFEKEN